MPGQHWKVQLWKHTCFHHSFRLGFLLCSFVWCNAFACLFYISICNSRFLCVAFALHLCWICLPATARLLQAQMSSNAMLWRSFSIMLEPKQMTSTLWRRFTRSRWLLSLTNWCLTMALMLLQQIPLQCGAQRKVLLDCSNLAVLVFENSSSVVTLRW